MLRPRLLAGVALCLAIYFINDWRPWEPRYHGASLSQWLETLKSEEPGERAQARVVLIEIGPEAAPGLARFLVDHDPDANRGYSALHTKLPAFIAGILPAPAGIDDESLWIASEALCLMGPAAKEAWPILRLVLAEREGIASGCAHHIFDAMRPDDAETVDFLVKAFVANPGIDFAFDNLNLLMSRDPAIAGDVATRLVDALKAEQAKPVGTSDNLNALCHAVSLVPPNHAVAPEASQILQSLSASTNTLIRIHAQFALWKLNPDYSPPRRGASERCEPCFPTKKSPYT
jgi:hypothetical protein